MQCGICCGSSVLYFHGLICSTSYSGFSIPPPRSLCSSWGKGSCEWQVVSSPSRPSCCHTSSEQSPIKWLVRFGWGGLWLLGGCSWRSRGMGEEMTSDPCGSIVPLWHPSGAGPGHLIRLDTSGTATTGERERTFSPETPLTLSRVFNIIITVFGDMVLIQHPLLWMTQWTQWYYLTVAWYPPK